MVRYLTKHKVLFVHIPRTGGTWIARALPLLGIDLTTWREDIPLKIPRNHQLILYLPIERLCDVSFRFAFVRHPVAYYESTWKWLNMGSYMRKHWKWHPHMSAYKLYSPDFNQWVQRMLDEEPSWYTRLMESYIGPPGIGFMDYVGRVETLVTDFKKAMIRAGYKQQVRERWAEIEKLPPIRVIKYDIQWNPELKKRVLATERPMIERFYK